MALRCLLVVLGLAAGAAQAQFTFEPYGRIDVGLVAPAVREDVPDSTVVGNPTRLENLRLSAGSRNRIGLRLNQDLGGAWKLRLVGEQSLLGRVGERYFEDGNPRKDALLDAAVLASVSHYAFGRIDLGRRSELAADVAVAIQPWAGETVAGDRCASLLQWRCEHQLRRPWVLGGESPIYGDHFILAMQLSTQEGQERVAARVVYTAGARRGDIALRMGEHGDAVLLAGWIEPLGSWRLHVLVSAGSVEGSRRHYAFLGGTHPWMGGEVRVGAGHYRHDAEHARSDLGLGYHYPFRVNWSERARLVTYSNLTWRRVQMGIDQVQWDLGVKVNW